LLTQAIENLLNRNLGDSPRARELCASLRGKRVLVIMTGTPYNVAAESTGESLRLARDADGTFDAEIEGSPINLVALAGAAPEALLQSKAVQLRGDSEIAQSFRELVLLLRPDIEEELARLLGDSVGHRVWQLARGVFDFGRRAADTTVRNAAEYLAHERRDLVPRSEAESFMNDVDVLREDVDRMEARLALAARALEPAAAPDPAPGAEPPP
jgi:ubiquinone biosynthesis protein UbiJ